MERGEATPKATGELVERSTYHAYGGTESDYRPEHWNSFREECRFTGKEEDVEVGLIYFGKRFLNPLLNRWVSADPLLVQGSIDPGKVAHEFDSSNLNLYAYVNGHPLKSVDPNGLLEFSFSVSQVYDRDFKTATYGMVARMQADLLTKYGIATSTKKHNSWMPYWTFADPYDRTSSVELRLGSSKANKSARDSAITRMRKAGASKQDIARWDKARTRLATVIKSSETFDLGTESSKIDKKTKKSLPLIAAEYDPKTEGITLNPFTWFDRNGGARKGGTSGGNNRMGPIEMFLHELGHKLGCLSGGDKCDGSGKNQWDIYANPERATVDDVNAHTKMIPGVPERKEYAPRNGRIKMTGGESYDVPSEKQLKQGDP